MGQYDRHRKMAKTASGELRKSVHVGKIDVPVHHFLPPDFYPATVLTGSIRRGGSGLPDLSYASLFAHSKSRFWGQSEYFDSIGMLERFIRGQRFKSEGSVSEFWLGRLHQLLGSPELSVDRQLLPVHLQRLNKEQQESVVADLQPQQLVAAAGSGKTVTLSTRVVHQLQQGVPCENIQCITFTKDAAKSMQSRIQSVLSEAVKDQHACTTSIGWTSEQLSSYITQGNNNDNCDERILQYLDSLTSTIITTHGSPQAVLYSRAWNKLAVQLYTDLHRRGNQVPLVSVPTGLCVRAASERQEVKTLHQFGLKQLRQFSLEMGFQASPHVLAGSDLTTQCENVLIAAAVLRKRKELAGLGAGTVRRCNESSSSTCLVELNSELDVAAVVTRASSVVMSVLVNQKDQEEVWEPEDVLDELVVDKQERKGNIDSLGISSKFRHQGQCSGLCCFFPSKPCVCNDKCCHENKQRLMLRAEGPSLAAAQFEAELNWDSLRQQGSNYSEDLCVRVDYDEFRANLEPEQMKDLKKQAKAQRTHVLMLKQRGDFYAYTSPASDAAFLRNFLHTPQPFDGGGNRSAAFFSWYSRLDALVSACLRGDSQQFKATPAKIPVYASFSPKNQNCATQTVPRFNGLPKPMSLAAPSYFADPQFCLDGNIAFLELVRFVAQESLTRLLQHVMPQARVPHIDSAMNDLYATLQVQASCLLDGMCLWPDTNKNSDFELLKVFKSLGSDNFPTKSMEEDGLNPQTSIQSPNMYQQLVLRLYRHMMAQHDNVDFGDIIAQPIRFLRDCPAARKQVRERYRVVLVDECQDQSDDQFALLMQQTQNEDQKVDDASSNSTATTTATTVANNVPQSLFSVGDDDQAIYGFRGGSGSFFHHINRFLHTKQKIYSLPRSYRMGAAQAEIAHKLVKDLPSRHNKVISSLLHGGTVTTQNDGSEFNAVYMYLQARLRQLKLHWSDACVLSRTNNGVKEFKDFQAKVDASAVHMEYRQFWPVQEQQQVQFGRYWECLDRTRAAVPVKCQHQAQGGDQILSRVLCTQHPEGGLLYSILALGDILLPELPQDCNSKLSKAIYTVMLTSQACAVIDKKNPMLHFNTQFAYRMQFSIYDFYAQQIQYQHCVHVAYETAVHGVDTRIVPNLELIKVLQLLHCISKSNSDSNAITILLQCVQSADFTSYNNIHTAYTKFCDNYTQIITKYCIEALQAHGEQVDPLTALVDEYVFELLQCFGVHDREGCVKPLAPSPLVFISILGFHNVQNASSTLNENEDSVYSQTIEYLKTVLTSLMQQINKVSVEKQYSIYFTKQADWLRETSMEHFPLTGVPVARMPETGLTELRRYKKKYQELDSAMVLQNEQSRDCVIAGVSLLVRTACNRVQESLEYNSEEAFVGQSGRVDQMFDNTNLHLDCESNDSTSVRNIGLLLRVVGSYLSVDRTCVRFHSNSSSNTISNTIKISEQMIQPDAQISYIDSTDCTYTWNDLRDSNGNFLGTPTVSAPLYSYKASDESKKQHQCRRESRWSRFLRPHQRGGPFASCSVMHEFKPEEEVQFKHTLHSDKGSQMEGSNVHVSAQSEHSVDFQQGVQGQQMLSKKGACGVRSEIGLFQNKLCFRLGQGSSAPNPQPSWLKEQKDVQHVCESCKIRLSKNTDEEFQVSKDHVLVNTLVSVHNQQSRTRGLIIHNEESDGSDTEIEDMTSSKNNGKLVVRFKRENLAPQYEVPSDYKNIAWRAVMSSIRDATNTHAPLGRQTVSTIHRAKGLEWPIVVVLGAQEGVFPLRQGGVSQRVAFLSCVKDKYVQRHEGMPTHGPHVFSERPLLLHPELHQAPLAYDQCNNQVSEVSCEADETKIAYVAFTRAKQELVLFKPQSQPSRYFSVQED